MRINVIGEQESPLNQVQIDEARCYLSKMFGLYCGANADGGKGCKKSVEELRILWAAEFIKKGKSVPERKHPFLVVNEKLGYGLHREVDGKFEYCGNVNFFCKSCNMIFDRRTGDVKSGEESTFQSRKSHEVRPLFKNLIKDHLAKHVEICFKACINKWSGSKRFTCSQDVLVDAFDQEYDVTLDLIKTEDYDIKCTYPKCDGNHIILKGHPPTVKQTDFEAFTNELESEAVPDNQKN